MSDNWGIKPAESDPIIAISTSIVSQRKFFQRRGYESCDMNCRGLSSFRSVVSALYPSVAKGLKFRGNVKAFMLNRGGISISVCISSSGTPGHLKGLSPVQEVQSRPRPSVCTSSASTGTIATNMFFQASRRDATEALLPAGQKEQQDALDPPPDGGAPLTSWQVMVGLCALSVVICYADRSNISTAILPMAETFGWDKAFQGIVLSSFFLGYAATQVVGGQLADRLGGKLVLAGGVTLWSIFTFTLPAAAAAGTVPLLMSRVLLGVGEGVAFPAIHSLIARNVPYASQSSAVGMVTAASYVGTALAFGISPYIITTYGWPWVFYLFSASALLWLPLWIPVQTKPPAQRLPPLPLNAEPTLDPGITSTAARISSSSSSSSSASAGRNNGSTLAPASKGQAPSLMLLDPGFWALLKRREVWAICIAQYTGSWGMYGLLNWLPTFFSEFYGVQLADLGGYTLVPYIVQGGLGVVAGILADRLISSGWSVRGVRVSLQVVGMLGPAACLLLAVSPVVGASPAVASAIVTVGLGLSALTLGGVSTNHLDIAPKHAGVIFGAGNTAATLAGFISVPVTGYLLELTDSWPLVFGITAMHYVVGAIFWSMWVGDKALPEDDLDGETPPNKQLQP